MQLLSLNYGKNVIRSVLLALTLVVSQSANATIITYDLEHVVGSTYKYNYTVHNDTLAVAIEEFSIYFSHSETENLMFALPDDFSGWSPLVIQPDPAPAPLDVGWVDWLDYSGLGIATGDILSGFSVQFDWIGGASGPGSQFFEVFDPIDFGLLDSGQTVTATVPEPATIPLFLFGLIWLKRKVFTK